MVVIVVVGERGASRDSPTVGGECASVCDAGAPAADDRCAQTCATKTQDKTRKTREITDKKPAKARYGT